MKLLTPTGFEIDACDKSVEILMQAGFRKPQKESKAAKSSPKKKGK